MHLPCIPVNVSPCGTWFNTLRPRQDGCYFADDVLKCIFLNENVWISLKIPLKFVPRGPINNILALVQIMAWRWPGAKPLSEPMLVFVPTHICVTRPQWVKSTSEVSSFILSLFAYMFFGCLTFTLNPVFLPEAPASQVEEGVEEEDDDQDQEGREQPGVGWGLCC